jgi:hypothetical protein
MTIFKCLVKVSRPAKDGTVKMERVELLWKEKEDYSQAHTEKFYIINEFLDMLGDNCEIENIEELKEIDSF